MLDSETSSVFSISPGRVPLWLCLTLALVAAPCRADDPNSIALEALLQQARAEMNMPGVRAAVRTADGTIVRASAGLADVEARLPLTDTIGMPGGSTGKMFVAALAMLMVEDGTVSLDDPASKWLGETDWFERLPNANDIRIRHLLSHSAGIADYPSTMRFQLQMAGRVLRHGSAYFEPEELIGCVLGRRPLFAAGDGYRYTDAGYLVLGRLIEAASGSEYYELLQERILDPLGLDGVRPATQSILPDIATGYIGGGRSLKRDGRMKFDPRSEWTGGGLVTTPAMLVRFVAALAEGDVVTPQSLALMQEGGWRDPNSSDWHYGFGMFVYPEQAAFGHAGRWPGYRTRVMHYTTTGTTIAVQTNRDGRVDLAALIARIAALAR